MVVVAVSGLVWRLEVAASQLTSVIMGLQQILPSLFARDRTAMVCAAHHLTNTCNMKKTSGVRVQVF